MNFGKISQRLCHLQAILGWFSHLVQEVYKSLVIEVFGIIKDYFVLKVLFFILRNFRFPVFLSELKIRFINLSLNYFHHFFQNFELVSNLKIKFCLEKRNFHYFYLIFLKKQISFIFNNLDPIIYQLYQTCFFFIFLFCFVQSCIKFFLKQLYL